MASTATTGLLTGDSACCDVLSFKAPTSLPVWALGPGLNAELDAVGYDSTTSTSRSP